jgi:hypothetical protein
VGKPKTRDKLFDIAMDTIESLNTRLRAAQTDRDHEAATAEAYRVALVYALGGHQ